MVSAVLLLRGQCGEDAEAAFRFREVPVCDGDGAGSEIIRTHGGAERGARVFNAHGGYPSLSGQQIFKPLPMHRGAIRSAAFRYPAAAEHGRTFLVLKKRNEVSRHKAGACGLVAKERAGNGRCGKSGAAKDEQCTAGNGRPVRMLMRGIMRMVRALVIMFHEAYF